MEIATNPRRRSRRRRKSSSARRSRRSRRNPSLSISSIPTAAMAGFKPNVLMDGGVAVVGALGNSFVSGTVSGYLPGMLQSGWGNYGVGLATAGLLAAVTKMVAPKYASNVLMGGIIEVLLRVANEKLMPQAQAAVATAKGLADYLTQTQAADARQLGYMGDYLTEQAAQSARPLGGLNCGDDAVAEVLASDGLSGSLF